MSTENTDRPEDEPIVIDPVTDAALPAGNDSLEMPAITPVLGEDGEVVLEELPDAIPVPAEDLVSRPQAVEADYQDVGPRDDTPVSGVPAVQETRATASTEGLVPASSAPTPAITSPEVTSTPGSPASPSGALTPPEPGTASPEDLLPERTTPASPMTTSPATVSPMSPVASSAPSPAAVPASPETAPQVTLGAGQVVAGSSPEVAPQDPAPSAATEPDPRATSLRRRSLFTPEEDPSPAPEPDAPQALPVTETAVDPTPVSTPSPGTAAGATVPDEPDPETVPASRSEDDVLLDGSIVVGHPKSRAAAHWAAILVSLVTFPVSWFLLHDGASRSLSTLSPLRFGLSAGGLTLLVCGAALAVVGLWTARRSSLGAIVLGVLAVGAGAPFILVPGVMNTSFTPGLERMAGRSTIGSELATYLWADAASGKLVVLGLALIMVGVVSHSARRAGRREQEVVDRVRRAG